jgi:hypothetical protein
MTHTTLQIYVQEPGGCVDVGKIELSKHYQLIATADLNRLIAAAKAQQNELLMLQALILRNGDHSEESLLKAIEYLISALGDISTAEVRK